MVSDGLFWFFKVQGSGCDDDDGDDDEDDDEQAYFEHGDGVGLSGAEAK